MELGQAVIFIRGVRRGSAQSAQAIEAEHRQHGEYHLQTAVAASNVLRQPDWIGIEKEMRRRILLPATLFDDRRESRVLGEGTRWNELLFLFLRPVLAVARRLVIGFGGGGGVGWLVACGAGSRFARVVPMPQHVL